MVNNETLLGMYDAYGNTAHTYTTSYNTGESTHVYIGAMYIQDNALKYENSNDFYEYPKLELSINNSQKIMVDAKDIMSGNASNLKYEVPKNSNVTFTVYTKHVDAHQQGVELINFLMF